MKNPFRCCFGFRDHHRSSSGRASLRASLVDADSGSGTGVKERSAKEWKRGIKDGGDDDDDFVVSDVIRSPTLTSSLSSSSQTPGPIPFVRVDGSISGKGTISQGTVQSPEALASLLGIAERDARILLPPSSPAAPPPPAALFVRRRRRRRRQRNNETETEETESDDDDSLLLLVALEGVRLSIDCSRNVALVFSSPARPRGALDGCREPGLDDPLIAALADAARVNSCSSSSPLSSSSSSFANPDSFAPAHLMLECALESVCLALEERAGALEAEAVAAGDRLLECVGGSGGGGGRSGGGRGKMKRAATATATTKAATTTKSTFSSSSTTTTTREALEALRRVKGELSDLRAAAARVSGALAPSRSRQRALGVSAPSFSASSSSASSSGRQQRSRKQKQQQEQRRRRSGALPPPNSLPSTSLAWYEEAAEAAAARAGAAASSAETSSAGARGAEAAVRLALRRFGAMGLFI